MQELWSLRRGFDGRLGVNFSAADFSISANDMSDTKSVECGAFARLFDHSRRQLLEFSDRDDFSR